MENRGETHIDPAPAEVMECPTNSQPEPVRVCENTGSAKGLASKEESETTRKKNKKHKRHKSKKKKKKRKEEKGSSSESGLESDGEPRNQPSVKTEVGATVDGRDCGGAVEKASRTLLTGEDGEGRTKKEKRHMPKKKKKKSKKRDEEKMERKSPPHSPSGSTSVSGTESERECRPKSRLPTTSPAITADKLKEQSLSAACPDTQAVIASPLADNVAVNCKPVCGEHSAERKDFLTTEGLAAEHKGNQEAFCKSQDLPDKIPKRESAHREDTMKEDFSREVNRQGEQNNGHSSRSRSKSRSLSKSKGATLCKVQVKKSRSHSCSPKRQADKPGSRKAHSASKRGSRSASKRKDSPKRKRSRSHSGRRKSRSRSVRRSRRKSRSLSAKRRPRSKSRSKSLSRRNHSRSRSWRSRSHRRNQRSSSRSVRRTRQSRSRSRSRRRRSRSRSIRRTRRTRSRSVVILRRSRSQRNKRSPSARRRRSRTRSPKRRQSKSRSKSRSLQQKKHSKSRSPGRRHRSKSRSPKRGRKKSKTPERKHSKSSSPARKELKSRSVSRDGQSSERSLSPVRVELSSKPGSHSKSQLDADLTSSETEEKRVIPEITDQVDVTSVNTEVSSLKAEAPFDLSSQETGESSALCAEHSIDQSEKDVSPMGSWKPVPPLVDSKTGPNSTSVQEVASSATIKGQGDVTTNMHENKSPPNGEDAKCFPAKMPLINREVSEPIVSYTASHDTQPILSSAVVSEDGNEGTECKSRSVSPQNDRLCEPLPSSDRSALGQSEGTAFTEMKPELDIVTPHDCGSSKSRSPVKHDGDCSHSSSTEEKQPATIKSMSPVQSKKHTSSKQRQPSKSPTQKKSRSASRNKRSNSRSPLRRKRSRSTSSSHRKRSQTKSTKHKKSKSKSPTKKRKSRSPSRSRKKRSKSKSPSRRRRSRSKSAGRKRKSPSKSRNRAKRSQSRSPKRKRSRSRSPARKKRSKSRSPARRRRSKSADKSKRSKSRSPARRRRSRSRARRSRSRRSSSRRRRSGFPLDRRDRWKRTPSHSPVLILRKRRSTSRPRRSSSKTPPRLTELDKDQLLEIAKANAAAMCTKAGMPIPESLRPKSVLQLPLSSGVSTAMGLPLPLNLPLNLSMGMSNMPNIAMNAALSTMSALMAMPALPTITNKPPPTVAPNTANIEEVKRKVTQKANSISIKELTEKCKKIAESKEEMAIAKPHVSDDEDDEKPFGGLGLKENKGITFSLTNSSAKPVAKTEAAFAKEFPVSSGSQHRKKEGEGAYGEWVPVDKKTEKAAAATPAAAPDEETKGKDSDSVFPDAPLQPVDITLAVSERAVAQKRLAENPFDVNAICMLSRAQEQVDAWAQSNTIPGLFTGSTGAQVLSSEELSTSGPQAWIKKDQFLRAAPVSGGVGEFLMRKMGWRAGEGLGKYREGTVEPIVIDFKTDRKGLVAEGEKTQKSGSLVVMKDLLGKHPVSALMEMCNKKKWAPPEFVMVHDSGPDHRKNFLFKVMINGGEYQPQTASPNKKHAKAMAATVALQAMGEVSGDNVYSGPVFTAATTTA
ncbi:protein SON-like isoform X2 [Conger conger]|nr:protein SON-like isoform X2 [Conger conger]